MSKTIDLVTYETAYVERPVPDIAKFIRWQTIINDPPNNSSPTTLNELKKLSHMTLNRSDSDVRLVHTIDTSIDSVFKALVTKYKLIYPINYITEFYKIIQPIIYNIKSFYNRPRPYQLAKYYNIPISIIITDTHDTAAYPSGHTVYSNLVANILNHMYPQIAKYELTSIVKQTGIGRMMQGVHYPSDNEAAVVLSDYLFNSLYPKIRNNYHV